MTVCKGLYLTFVMIAYCSPTVTGNGTDPMNGPPDWKIYKICRPRKTPTGSPPPNACEFSCLGLMECEISLFVLSRHAKTWFRPFQLSGERWQAGPSPPFLTVSAVPPRSAARLGHSSSRVHLRHHLHANPCKADFGRVRPRARKTFCRWGGGRAGLRQAQWRGLSRRH